MLVKIEANLGNICIFKYKYQIKYFYSKEYLITNKLPHFINKYFSSYNKKVNNYKYFFKEKNFNHNSEAKLHYNILIHIHTCLSYLDIEGHSIR